MTAIRDDEPTTAALRADVAALTERALASVADERAAQIAKWGKQDCNWAEFVSILTEEVGEAATDANKARWAKDEETAERHVRLLRTELVQTAAVAVQIIEHIDETLDLLAPTPPPAPAPDEDDTPGVVRIAGRAPDEAAKWGEVVDAGLSDGYLAARDKAIELNLAAPADRAVVVTDAMARAAWESWHSKDTQFAYTLGDMRKAIEAALRAAPAGADTEGEG